MAKLIPLLTLLLCFSVFANAETQADPLSKDIKHLLSLSGSSLVSYRNQLVKKWSNDVDRLTELSQKLPILHKCVAEGIVARIKHPKEVALLENDAYPKAMNSWRHPKLIPGTMTVSGSRRTDTFKPRASLFVAGSFIDKTQRERYNSSNDPTAPYLLERHISRTIPNNAATKAFVFELAVTGWHLPLTDQDMISSMKSLGDLFQYTGYMCCQSYLLDAISGIYDSNFLEALCKDTDTLDKNRPMLFHIVSIAHNKGIKVLYPEIVERKTIFESRIPYGKDKSGKEQFLVPQKPKRTGRRGDFWVMFAEIEKWVEEHPSPSSAPDDISTEKPPVNTPEKRNNSPAATETRTGYVTPLLVVLACLLGITLVVLRRKRKWQN